MKSGVIFFGMIAIVESMSTVEMLRNLMATRPEGKTDFSSEPWIRLHTARLLIHLTLVSCGN